MGRIAVLSFKETLTKYNKLNKQVITTAYLAYKKKPLKKDYPKYCHILYSKIIENNLSQKGGYILSKEDIQQQLNLIWFQAVNNYNKNKPAISFKQYLIRISIFKLRDFFKKEFHIPAFIEKNELYANNPFPNFTLDLNFVINGGNKEPWDKLYPYERYLLYLTYTKEMPILEVNKRLKWDKDTITSRLSKTLEKLKNSIDYFDLAA